GTGPQPTLAAEWSRGKRRTRIESTKSWGPRGKTAGGGRIRRKPAGPTWVKRLVPAPGRGRTDDECHERGDGDSRSHDGGIPTKHRFHLLRGRTAVHFSARSIGMREPASLPHLRECRVTNPRGSGGLSAAPPPHAPPPPTLT